MSELQKTKLGLVMATDPRWVNIAEMQIGEILSDLVRTESGNYMYFSYC